MKELLFYLVIGIILYYVLTLVIEKYYSQTENFDPSLVPVSSIVSLAKVAQKIANGNGVLTNPANLQIGSSATAPGNLTVTGPSVFNGPITFSDADILGGPSGSESLRFKFDNNTIIASPNNINFQNSDGVNNMTLDNAGNLTLKGELDMTSTGNTNINANSDSGLKISSNKLNLNSSNITLGNSESSGTLTINGGLTANSPSIFNGLTVKNTIISPGFNITDSSNVSNNFNWSASNNIVNLNNNAKSVFSINNTGNILLGSNVSGFTATTSPNGSVTTNRVIFGPSYSLATSTSGLKLMNTSGTNYSPSGFAASKFNSIGNSKFDSLNVTGTATLNNISVNAITFNTGVKVKDSNETTRIEFNKDDKNKYISSSGHNFINGTTSILRYDNSTSKATLTGTFSVLTSIKAKSITFTNDNSSMTLIKGALPSCV